MTRFGNVIRNTTVLAVAAISLAACAVAPQPVSYYPAPAYYAYQPDYYYAPPRPAFSFSYQSGGRYPDRYRNDRRHRHH